MHWAKSSVAFELFCFLISLRPIHLKTPFSNLEHGETAMAASIEMQLRPLSTLTPIDTNLSSVRLTQMGLAANVIALSLSLSIFLLDHLLWRSQL